MYCHSIFMNQFSRFFHFRLLIATKISYIVNSVIGLKEMILIVMTFVLGVPNFLFKPNRIITV